MLIHRLLHGPRVFALIELLMSPLQRCSFNHEEEELSWLLDHARSPDTEDRRVVEHGSHVEKPEFGLEHAQDSDSHLLGAIHGQNLVLPVARESQLMAHTQVESDVQNAAHQRSLYPKAHSPKRSRQPIADPNWEDFNPALINAPDGVLNLHGLDTAGNPPYDSSWTVEEGLGCMVRAPPLPQPQPRQANLSNAEGFGFLSRQRSMIPMNALYATTKSAEILVLSASLPTDPPPGSNLQHASPKETQDFGEMAMYISSMMGWETPVSSQEPMGPCLDNLPEDLENQNIALESLRSPIWSHNADDAPLALCDTSGILPSTGSLDSKALQTQYRQAEDQDVLTTQARHASDLNWSHSSDKTFHPANTPLGLLSSSQVTSNPILSSTSSNTGQSSIIRMERIEDATISADFDSSPSHSEASWLPHFVQDQILQTSVNLLDHSASDHLLHMVNVEQPRQTQSQLSGESSEDFDAGTHGQPQAKKIRLLSGHGTSEVEKDRASSDSLDFILFDPVNNSIMLTPGQQVGAKQKLYQMLDIIKSYFPNDVIPNLPAGLLAVHKDRASNFLQHVNGNFIKKKIHDLMGLTSHREKNAQVERHHSILANQEFEHLQSQEPTIPHGSIRGDMNVQLLSLAKLNENYTLDLDQGIFLSKYQGELLAAMKRALVHVRMFSTIFRDSPDAIDFRTHRLETWNFFRNYCMEAILHVTPKRQNQVHVSAEIGFLLNDLNNNPSHTSIKKVSVRLLTIWLEQFRPELFKVWIEKGS